MFEFFPAKNNILSASYANKLLHSKFDPQKEAIKFIDLQKIDSDSQVILIFPCLPYLAQALLAKYPEIKFLIINPDKIFTEKYPEKISKHIVTHDEKAKIKDFLYENNTRKLNIITWDIATRIFENEYLSLSNFLKDNIKEKKHNLATGIKFGKLWTKNHLRNISNLQTNLKISFANTSVIIIAPGPSLEKNIDLLKTYQNKFITIACSSALEILKQAEFIPDFVINIDPGYYSGLYMDKYFADKTIGLFSATSNTIFPRYFGRKFIFSDNEDLNKIFPGAKYLPQITESASVAIAGLKIAKFLNASDVFFLGLDLNFANKMAYPKNHKSFINQSMQENRFNKTDTELFERNKDYDYRKVLELFSKSFQNLYQNYKFYRIADKESLNFDISIADFKSFADKIIAEKSYILEEEKIQAKEKTSYFTNIENTMKTELQNLKNGKTEKLEFFQLYNYHKILKYKENIFYFENTTEKLKSLWTK